jgi:hypothetical protein
MHHSGKTCETSMEPDGNLGICRSRESVLNNATPAKAISYYCDVIHGHIFRIHLDLTHSTFYALNEECTVRVIDSHLFITLSRSQIY